MSFTKTTIAALTLTALSLTATGTAQSYLPTHNLSAIRSSLKQRDLRGALRTALNSEGDSVALDLYASGKVNLSTYVGGSGSFVVEVRKTANGYEVVATAQQAVQMGVDGFTGMGINVTGARDMSVVFGFPNVDRCAEGMKYMTVARLLRLDRAMTAAYNAANGARQGLNRAHQGFWRAVQNRQIAQRTEQAMKRSYDAANRILRTFYTPLYRAKARVSSARSRLAAAKRRLSQSRTRFGRRVAWAGIRIAEGFLNSLQRSLNRIDASYRRSLADMRTKKAKWYRWASKARQAIQSEAKSRRNYEIAKGRLAKLQSEASQIRAIADRLGWMYAGSEFKVSGNAGIVAGLSAPGVTLGNLGLDASLAAQLELAVRFEMKNNQRVLSIHAATGVSLGASAAAGVGTRAKLDTNLEVDVVFTRNSRNGYYYRTGALNVALVVDMEILGTAGAGFYKAHGIGRTYTITMAEREWSRVRRAGRTGLLRSMTTVPSSVTVQDRWVSAGRFAFGADLRIVSFEVGGGATWMDLGAEVSKGATGARLLTNLTKGTELRNASRTLSARLR